jgi:riboflavin biosynthesis pyrimidine reductase
MTAFKAGRAETSAVLAGGPLERLFERDDLEYFGVPERLSALYGGDFGIVRPRLFANFVESVDGTVALPDAGESGHIISGDNVADRFVMGLLRACADAVLIGAGTFRTASNHLWHAERIFPAAAAEFRALRQKLGLSPAPKLVLLTGSGEIDPHAPAMADALVITTPESVAKVRRALPGGARVVAARSSPIGLPWVLEFLRAEGHELLLTEGGPSLVGELVAQSLLDELFVTVSPRIFGRSPGDARKSLIHGVDLLGTPLELASVRRHGSHLFLRYEIENGSLPRGG